MDQPLDRDEVIRLLDALGDEDDAAVLATARQLHNLVEEAGASWDALLVPEPSEIDDDPDVDDPDVNDPDVNDPDDDDAGIDGDGEDGRDDAVDEAALEPEQVAARNQSALQQIKELLALSGISDDLREELEDYRKEIQEGEFAQGDRRYIEAVHKRLVK
ncbi:MAG: hypothetical protein AAF530_10200 [Pseudomonadota bacterium]